jgi:hypothetical protein
MLSVLASSAVDCKCEADVKTPSANSLQTLYIILHDILTTTVTLGSSPWPVYG